MKPKTLKKNLVLNKETIAHLRDNEMQMINGKGATKPPSICDCVSTGCPTKEIVICTTY